MLTTIGRAVVRRRALVIGFWLAATAVVGLTAPQLGDIADYSSQGFLPKSAASKLAEAQLDAIRAGRFGHSNLVVALTRDSGLTPADEAAGQRLCARLEAEKERWGIQTVAQPWAGPEHRAQLLSANGKTAMVVLGMAQSSYDHQMPARVVALRGALAAAGDLPPGLEVHLTGEGAFSADEHLMVAQGMSWIAGITVAVVVLVLFLIFRSPVAPLLPLSVIGLSFLLSRGLIGYLNGLGLSVSAYTETFLIAVLFGAGTDYCLLLMSRYRDELGKGLGSAAALAMAQRWSAEAILSSGGATIVGFLGMGLAVFGLYNSIGPSVALGVAVTLLLVLSLTPALISILGPNVFWSFRHRGAWRQPSNARWERLSAALVRRPRRVALLTVACFLPVLAVGFTMQRSFDQVSELPAGADSRRGYQALERDFGAGSLMPVYLVVKADKDLWGLRALPALDDLAAHLAGLPDVALVRTATRPTGERVDRLAPGLQGDPSAPLRLPKMAIATHPELKAAMETFMAPDGRSAYLEVTLKSSPYVEASIDMSATLRQAAAERLRGGWLDGATVSAAGATAMFADLRQVTAADFLFVMAVVLAGVFAVLALLLRSLVAPLYLLGTIVLSFASTMGLCQLFFHLVLGWEGVNWAVQFFSFCVLVALGVDYNIFLMSRVKEEYRPGDMAGTVRRSLAGTGKIITSCGLIMAGCFCAMLASPMRSIQEVGFATVAGLLIDTFVIRTLLVPSLAVLAGEANWWPWPRRAAPAAAPAPEPAPSRE